MKIIAIFLVTVGLTTPMYSQETFLYSPALPKDNTIFDAMIRNDTTFVLEVTVDTTPSSSIVFLNDSGNILNQFPIDLEGFKAMRFFPAEPGQLLILGTIHSSICESTVVILEFNLTSETTMIRSSYAVCDAPVEFLRISPQLDSDYLILVGTLSAFHKKYLLGTDSMLNMHPLLDSLASYLWVSLDFSRNGYVLKNESICFFCDENFGVQDAVVNPIPGALVYEQHQTHRPFSDQYLIENFAGALDFFGDEIGQYVRIVDHNLLIVRSLLIPPQHPISISEIEAPLMGGLDFIDESSIWIAGNNEITTDFSKPNHYSLSKADDDLVLQCTRYLGFDAFYKLVGIRATTDGGVMAYGSKWNESMDPFLIKLGPDCELPTSSLQSPEHPLTSISAYPNPGINELTFSVEGFNPASLSVEIVDAIGRLLFSTLDLSNSIQVPDLPAGQYFYRILQEDKLLGVGGWVKQ